MSAPGRPQASGGRGQGGARSESTGEVPPPGERSAGLPGWMESAEEMHPSDIADLVAAMESEEQQLAVLGTLPTELASDTLAEMEEYEDRAELLSSLDAKRGTALLQDLPDDDAADLLGEMEPGDRDRMLAALPTEDAVEIRELLRYGEETAGGLMTTTLVSVTAGSSAADAIAEIRRQGREVEDFYTVFVVDDRNRLEGTVPIADLILSDPGEPVAALVQPAAAVVYPDTDQEEVGRVMGRYNLVSVPVVGTGGVLLGRITFDDVIDVIEAETTEDILKLAGVSEEEELKADWLESVRSRLPWLTLNLVTAALAAAVILSFEDLISAAPFLAFLMPVIAALGGNTGTQALAVTIRRIAIGDGVRPGHFQAVRKEVAVGLLNGFVLGALFAVGAYLWEGDPMLGVVVLLAMWANIIVAGFAGAMIPTVLDRLGVDPAVASSVFVHTLTDLVGFVMVLTLAMALLQ
ncbi:MAG: magnesium transporter [Gemmatimonadetes bacterium]|nr:magnesium transporter [Gemmatimonadota bacterium]MXX34588.1 magnesium transporter [Gemmatimonadota bacterium]MYA12625.1 magnesium transporter [Gemmatimonadota bacterium]MYD12684.1 magnesium transporter [Gemmatimonadota bacterium]MYE68422.1 magnesium transporter [Gemmatimonadota bacterium]